MFSPFITTSLLLLLASTLVFSASAPSLDATTLLSNGQEAQSLNVLFQTLNSSDPCADGDKACIDGAIASCGNGTWDTTRGRCAKTQNCFAVPDTRKAGTILSCTSEKGAISAIEATGATGGILGNTNTTSTSNGSTGQDDGRGRSSNSASTSTATSLSITPPVTVTVTLTAQVTTLPPETRTLSPQEASSLLASLMADGATIINPPSTTSTASANAVNTLTLGNQSTGVPTTNLPSEPVKVHSSVMATSSASSSGY